MTRSLYTDPESHNAQCFSQLEKRTEGRTDWRHDDANRSIS